MTPNNKCVVCEKEAERGFFQQIRKGDSWVNKVICQECCESIRELLNFQEEENE